MMKVILLLALFATFCCQDESLYTLKLFSQDGGASCLDGSRAGIYFHNGVGQNRKKILLFFDKGGFCAGVTLDLALEDCYQRTNNDLGSTLNAPGTRSFNGHGILSPIREQNPTFYDWTKIFFIYCDGTVFLGNREEPYTYKDTQLYFRGYKNVQETFSYLQSAYDLSSADQIVISGVSAGGLAAYAYSNTLVDRAPSSRVLVLPDSGVFLTEFQSLINNVPIFQVSALPLSQLVQDLTNMPSLILNCMVNNLDNPISCYNSMKYVSEIKAPVMVIQSAYDSYSIMNIVRAQCISTEKPHSLANCQQTELNAIERYRTQMLSYLRNLAQSGNSVWSPSCAQHGFLDEPSFSDSSYTAAGLSLSDAVSRFVQNSSTVQTLIDSQGWPSNAGCNGLSKAKPCFYEKTFELKYISGVSLRIYRGNMILKTCKSGYDRFTLKRNQSSDDPHQIEFNLVSRGCEGTAASAYQEILLRSTKQGILSNEDRERLLLFEQDQMIAYMEFNKRRKWSKINQFTLEGFYMLHIAPVSLSFASNGRFTFDQCGQGGGTVFQNDQLQFVVSPQTTCSDPHISHLLRLLREGGTYTVDNSTCEIQQMNSEGQLEQTLFAQPIENIQAREARVTSPPQSVLQSMTANFTFDFPGVVIRGSIQNGTFKFQGCRIIHSKFQTSGDNKIKFGAFYAQKQQYCRDDRDGIYVRSLFETTHYKIQGTTVTMLDEYDYELLILQLSS